MIGTGSGTGRSPAVESRAQPPRETAAYRQQLAHWVSALLDPGGLAAQGAQVVQLGTAHPTLGDNLDHVDGRSVDREGPLHTDAVADLAHGKGLSCAAALPADDNTLEHLDPGAVTLLDPDMHLQGVTRPESRDVGSNLRALKLGNRGVHRFVLGCHNAHACGRAELVWPPLRHATASGNCGRERGRRLSVCHIFATDRETSLS